MAIDKKNRFLKIMITMDNDYSQKTTVSYAVIAIVAALGLLGVVVLTVTVTIPLQQQQAEARGCESGIPNSERGINASNGRCFGH
jgi:hypothetical protein